MKLAITTLAALVLVWLPARQAAAQSDVDPQVAACLNASALSGMNEAGARVDLTKTRYPPEPGFGSVTYVAESDSLYTVAPDRLRYYARLDNGEPLFVRFGTELGEAGSLYMLVRTAEGDRGCGFMRFRLREPWMTIFTDGQFWMLIDRASISYEAGTFKFESMTLGGYRKPTEPEHAYGYAYQAFKCPNLMGLLIAANMTAEGEALWAGRYTGEDDEPNWSVAGADRAPAFQRFFCGNGAGASTARHFPDKESALAAWRAEHGN